MAKDSIRDFSATAGSNTDIQSVNIDENCPASGINNAIRELMVDLKNVSTGAVNLETPGADQLNVDNLRLDGNTISSTDTNGNVTIDPAGTGVVAITGGFTATDGCTITTADNTSQLTLTSTDADATVGPRFDLKRDSGSPSDGDTLGRVRYLFDNDAAEQTEGVRLDGIILDASDGTEDIQFELSTLMAGTLRSRLKLGTETVFNEASQDIDFRVESSVSSHHLFIEGNANYMLVGKSDSGSDVVGCTLRTTGQASFTMDGNGPLILNRKSSDGEILFLQKDNTTIGHLKVVNNDNLAIDCTSTNHSGLEFSTNELVPRRDGAQSDDTINVGAATVRFDNIYATNGTIQTSDQNEKQDIASLTSAEITAAKAISKLFKTYKWKSKVAAKGDAARTHTGVIAQEVQTAMTDAGLDASKYAFWCSDTWWETSTEVAAVEAVDEVRDEDGNVTTEAVEAKDAYTDITTYRTADAAPEGAIERTRLGVRYPELLAFIGAATEQRLADIEKRLTALES